MRLNRVITMILSLMTTALLSFGVASAAPSNAPNAEIITLNCDSGERYTIVANGNGNWTPGHVIDGDGRVLIPVAFTFTGFDADGNVLFSDSITKKGQMKGQTGDLITCSFGGTFEENGETFTFVGTVTGFAVPRN